MTSGNTALLRGGADMSILRGIALVIATFIGGYLFISIVQRLAH